MTRFRLALATIAVLFFGTAQAAAGSASLVVDARTGRVLSAENPDTLNHPASLTKMMTLYMTFEALHRGQLAWKTPVPMSATAARKPPTKLGVRPGETITVQEAVYGMIVRSANDAAAAMAERLGGTEEGFARMMNAKARQLGMNRTFFVNASGLPASEQVTTARDMARLAVALMRHYPREYRLFSVQSFAFRGRVIRGHNNLMYRYQGMDGIKTGYTRASGYNLVSAVAEGNRRLIGVVLGGRSARSRDEKMAALLDQHLGRVSSPGRPMIASANAPRLADVASLPGVSLSYAGTKPAVEALAAPAAAAPTTVPAAVAAASAPSFSNGWRIQLSTAPTAEGARKMLVEAQSAGGAALLGGTPHSEAAGKAYRVGFVGFVSREAAAIACDVLKKRSYDCVLLPDEG
ncbi:D-alanyl-D-alanine carboxypeptidase family protein [Sinorhizobium medicae]|uniref:D-alanyl-D-alanine carboxypeptidase family protein n=1 Tax=Sinorhizobium medicae TaxID=110321 RepID=UPI002AF6BAF8|nr:D-alanyl-D-alanine carboxypeptidase family protein [Sinorhizobium medicae]WQO46384.1 D-alanyl-D-alanine carboxypeptidase family protein [Sinorhizobium medicae]WQO66508.1 D-alanyl-D-alanine carboxypeptidase family protein [Sinorhizobium medicae]WQO73640.1 D-alanyl-D-alanine carboxypeptidase family protein [Sinorhizobium medicae]WQO92985.1 D-alanyl-D-alanine carboxypeptidase family protein [Sinorhizobium medicae]